MAVNSDYGLLGCSSEAFGMQPEEQEPENQNVIHFQSCIKNRS